jgi:1-deoxy-D-xylulose-5-phosphate synthase
MSVLQVVPGLRIAAPRDTVTLRAELREAVNVSDAPTVVRFPKASVGDDITAIDSVGGMDVLYRSGDDDVLVVSVGALAPMCLDLAARIADQGIGVTVVDPRWVKPLDLALPALAARHRLVVSVEDNGRVSGVGDAVAGALRDAGVPTPVRVFGLPQRFLEHASRAQVLADVGLDAQSLARDVIGAIARIDHALEVRSES